MNGNLIYYDLNHKFSREFISTAGGQTITGILSLNTDTNEPKSAVNMETLNSLNGTISNTYVKKAGDDMTGPLTISSGGIKVGSGGSSITTFYRSGNTIYIY